MKNNDEIDLSDFPFEEYKDEEIKQNMMIKATINAGTLAKDLLKKNQNGGLIAVYFLGMENMYNYINDAKINKIIEILRSTDYDDYEYCVEISKVVGIYHDEEEGNK